MSWTYLGSKIVKARKASWCWWCLEKIDVGEACDVRSGVEDGQGFSTMRMHPECSRYENSIPWKDREDWYDDAPSEPMFTRAHAIASTPAIPSPTPTEPVQKQESGSTPIRLNADNKE